MLLGGRISWFLGQALAYASMPRGDSTYFTSPVNLHVSSSWSTHQVARTTRLTVSIHMSFSLYERPFARMGTMSGKSGGRSSAKQVLRTNAERRHEIELAKLRFQGRYMVVENIFTLLGRAVFGTAIVFCFYCIYLSVQSVSGRVTQFNAIVSAVTDLKLNQWAAAAVAVISSSGWITEHRLRRRTINAMTSHITELETRLAPERKSSGLLPDGRTKREDKDAV
jgi:hypothetical protein